VLGKMVWMGSLGLANAHWLVGMAFRIMPAESGIEPCPEDDEGGSWN
jgi:hypothetical protein